MNNLPATIDTVEQLEDIMTTPSAALVEFVKTISGDLMILGAGGKIGPTLCMSAKRAFEAAGLDKQVIAVDVAPLDYLASKGIKTIKCDLLDPADVAKLPEVQDIIFMVGRKFGSTGGEHLTWAINVMVPHNVARRFTKSRIVSVSTGCVYPVADMLEGASTEQMPANPVGEYAMSCLGRERMFDFFSSTQGQRVTHFRLNYSIDLRYGVLVDIAQKVWSGEPVDLTTGYFNAIWQGDTAERMILSLGLASAPATIVNVTGPETVSVRAVATKFGELLGKKPVFTGVENGKGYLSDAMFANSRFGNPRVPMGTMINWVAGWIKSGNELLGKPTHFETQDGNY